MWVKFCRAMLSMEWARPGASPSHLLRFSIHTPHHGLTPTIPDEEQRRLRGVLPVAGDSHAKMEPAGIRRAALACQACLWGW